MRTVAHIINPVAVSDASDLFVAQPITFESMRTARAFAAEKVDVQLLVTHYPEDVQAAPDDFTATSHLSTSVLDYGAFDHPRKLPLIKDILDRLYDTTNAEYLIYTNVDIGLQPHFYVAVDQFIAQGHDAFVINRRTIPATYDTVDELPLMYAEIGKPHRGWDCFVFRRDVYSRYNLGTVCVGASRVGLALLSNLVAWATHFREYTDAHLTFHIGDERRWLNPAYGDYDQHNTRELMTILRSLEREAGVFDRTSIPGSFLLRTRRLGPLYDVWSRYVRLPIGLSRLLNRIARGR